MTTLRSEAACIEGTVVFAFCGVEGPGTALRLSSLGLRDFRSSGDANPRDAGSLEGGDQRRLGGGRKLAVDAPRKACFDDRVQSNLTWFVSKMRELRHRTTHFMTASTCLWVR